MDNSNTLRIELTKRKIFLSRFKRRILKHIWITRGFILTGLIGLVILFFYFGYIALRDTTIGNYAGLARDFIVPTQTQIGDVQNNINILLMGKGGAGHDAPDLTDTMIAESVDPVNRRVTLISIPRDLWIDDLKAKINTAYFYGNQKKRGGGLILAKSTVEEVLGIPINYAAVVDFNIFKDVVDILGGITVNVKNGFIDKQFPIPGREADLCLGDPPSGEASPTFACRYETIEFKAGVQNMNGDTALKFVRSRHAIGDEGTDLAREARQQLVISAIVRKLGSLSVFLSFSKIRGLIDIANRNIETDIKPDVAAALARYVFGGRGNIKSYSIPTELLISPPLSAKYLNTYVFVPVGGNWDKIHEWVSGVLKN